jgi:type IV secretory pathway ATPase VirB11/archaellum biosynthesis ATPase
VKTGHPIITTLHSDRLDHIYERMVSMLLIDESMSHADQFKVDVKEVFPVLVQLVSNEFEGGIQRVIDQVSIIHQGVVHILNHDVDDKIVNKVIESW